MCFYCQQLGHTIVNCLKSITKVAIVIEIVNIVIDNNKKSKKE